VQRYGALPPDHFTCHRFGTEALRAGVPLKDVADLMGHASVTTTEIYLHRDVTELASGQDRLPQVWDGESPATAG
jgi:site-specific recombinase XerD